MSDNESFRKPEPPSIRPIDWYAQHPPRPAHAVQVAVHHAGRDPVAGARHWREFGDFLAVRPDAAAAAAGAESRGAGQLQVARAQAGIEFVQPGGQLRRDFQLPDVPGSRARADQLHGHRRASQLRRQPRLPGHVARRRRPARVGQLLPGARPDAGARPAVHARGRQDRSATISSSCSATTTGARRFAAESRPSSTRRSSSTARR